MKKKDNDTRASYGQIVAYGYGKNEGEYNQHLGLKKSGVSGVY